MTYERLLQMLEDPVLLAGIPYEELKTLALSYPYAHNLRYLLAMKAHREQRPDAAKTLTTASVYSLNRSQLFALIVPQRVAVAQEEVLELKPIETLQKNLENRVPLPRYEAGETKQTLSEPLPAVDPAVQSAAVKTPTPEVEPAEKPERIFPRVQQRPSFGVWISQFQLPHLEPEAQAVPVETHVADAPSPPTVSKPEDAGEDALPALGDDPVQAPPPPKSSADAAAETGQLAQRLAERSVTENKEIASETLARLYWRQGHREKALAMYERLILLFPEKSAYFAAEIEKLKK
jgi:tetratricopeptide (TPR) repeat protein